MKKITGLLVVLLISTCIKAEPEEIPSFFHADTQWTVVGAGPAGIISVGLLIDLGVSTKDITWVDPEFKVGRIGKYYQNVHSNLATRHFFECLNACRTFRECAAEHINQLLNLDLDYAYPLEIVVKPLQAITDNLCTQIHKKEGQLTGLNFVDDLWQVSISSGEKFSSAHVILATGAKPKVLNYECKETIPLDFALDKPTLATLVTMQDTIGVIGSAHSAILILKYLSEVSVGRIINFYLHEPEFVHPYLGLGGLTAEWARDVLLPNPPSNLLRVYSTPQALKAWLPVCTKVIYAVGYERSELPNVNGTQISHYDKSGIIAPRLFGIGIAFPEKYIDEQGNAFNRIGLPSFMDYAQRVIPNWIGTKDVATRFSSFEDLFDIRAL